MMLLGGALVSSGAASAGDIISVPIRWCAMKGSPAAENPRIDGKTTHPDGKPITTDDVLWNRHERATDHIYLDNRALSPEDDPRITFRSAYDKQIRDSPTQSFPILEDLDLDKDGNTIAGTQGPGEEGDVLDFQDDNATTQEFVKRILACERKWSELKDEAGKPIKIDWGKGVTVLNVNKVSKKSGNRESFRGFAWTSRTDLDKSLSHPFAVVTDLSYAKADSANPRIVSFDTLLAHEMGHALNLEHLSTGEDSTKTNVMCNGFLTTPKHSCRDQVDFTKAQSDTLRAFAKKIGNLDPPAVLLPGPLVADLKTDGLGEVLPPALDLAEFKVQEDTTRGVTAFIQVLSGVIPPTAKDFRYWTFADLDGDPSTGGAASDLDLLGVPRTTFAGVELVTLVKLDSVGGRLVAVGRLWKFDPGLAAFSSVEDPSVQALRETTLLFDANLDGDTAPLFDVVSIEFSNAIRGALPCPFRVHALTEFQAGTISRVDPLEESSPGAGFAACLVPRIDFPLCEARPSTARRSGSVEVLAEGLLPSAPAHAIFGETWVGGGIADSSGNYVLTFDVPAEARPGLHLLTVGSEGTALTADCIVEVEDFADCNENEIEDELDIAHGTSQDVDSSGVPDECETGSAFCAFRGTAAGGQVTLTIDGFFATCNVTVSTVAGQTAPAVAAALALAINSNGCLAAQGITGSALGSILAVSGFRIDLEDLTCAISDAGLSLDLEAVNIPTLASHVLLLYALLLIGAGALIMRQRWIA